MADHRLQIILAAKDITGNAFKQIQGRIKAMTKSIFSLQGGLATVGIGYAFSAIARDAVKAASDLQEVSSKFNVVFAGQEDAARRWTETLRDSYAMSTREARQYLSSVQDLLVPMGMQAEAAGRMSSEIVKLSADLGSFNNLPTAKVMDDIQSALVGNYETMKKYGVVLNARGVQEKALTMSLAASKDQLTASHKAQAAYALMVKGSAAAIGDMSRTAGDYANQMKQLGANMEEIKGIIGSAFLPALTSVVVKTNEWLKANEGLIAQKVPEYLAEVEGAVGRTYTALEKVYGLYQAIPDEVVGVAGTGIIGRILFGATPAGKIATGLLVINEGLSNFNMNIGRLAESSKSISESSGNIWDVLTGKRDWNTGLLKGAAADLDNLERAADRSLKRIGSIKPPTLPTSQGLSGPGAAGPTRDDDIAAQRFNERFSDAPHRAWRSLKSVSKEAIEAQNEMTKLQQEMTQSALIATTAINDLEGQHSAALKAAEQRQAMDDLAKVTEATAVTIKDSLTDAFDSASNSLTSFLMDGKSSFSDFTNSILNDLARIGMQKVIGGSFDAIFASIFHSGGVVGSGAGSPRSVPAGTFIGAPRLHSGLAADEFPAILQRGETVIPKDAGRAAEPVDLQIIVQNYSGQPATVRQSQGPGNLRQVFVMIANDIKNGGPMAGAIEQTYNIRRSGRTV